MLLLGYLSGNSSKNELATELPIEGTKATNASVGTTPGMNYSIYCITEHLCAYWQTWNQWVSNVVIASKALIMFVIFWDNRGSTSAEKKKLKCYQSAWYTVTYGIELKQNKTKQKCKVIAKNNWHILPSKKTARCILVYNESNLFTVGS